jgi:hypothetical protein
MVRGDPTARATATAVMGAVHLTVAASSTSAAAIVAATVVAARSAGVAASAAPERMAEQTVKTATTAAAGDRHRGHQGQQGPFHGVSIPFYAGEVAARAKSFCGLPGEA